MLADGGRGAVVADDELEGLVVPAVYAVAKVELMGTFGGGFGAGVVEADDEGGGFDGRDAGSVCRAQGLDGIAVLDQVSFGTNDCQCVKCLLLPIHFARQQSRR